jgi:hypothetical protein
VLNGTTSVLAHTGEEIIDLLKGGQGVLNIVPMAGLMQELEAAITRLMVSSEDLALAGAPPAVASSGG